MQHWSTPSGSKAAAHEVFIDLVSVANGTGSAWLKAAAFAAQAAGGLTVGAFLSRAPDALLAALREAAFGAQSGDADAQCEIHLLALMLANGEGLAVGIDDNVSELSRRMLMYLQAEQQRRSGRVRFDPMTLTLETLAIEGVQLVVRKAP